MPFPPPSSPPLFLPIWVWAGMGIYIYKRITHDSIDLCEASQRLPAFLRSCSLILGGVHPPGPVMGDPFSCMSLELPSGPPPPASPLPPHIHICIWKMMEMVSHSFMLRDSDSDTVPRFCNALWTTLGYYLLPVGMARWVDRGRW